MWHWSVLYCTVLTNTVMIEASDRLPSSSACFKFVNKCKISKFVRFKLKEFSRIFKYFQAPYLFSSTFNHLEVFIPNSSIFKDFSSTSWTLCKCVSAGRPWVVPNGWTNRYFPLEFRLVGPKEPLFGGGPDPHGKGNFWGVILGHAQSSPRSILSTLFAWGQKQCDLWLPVYCSNFLLVNNFTPNCFTATIQDNLW